MIQQHKKPGFTLIELMLSMAFISVLLLSIVTIAIQAGRTYNRGLVLSSVNSAGRDITDVIRRDFLQTDLRQVAKVGSNPVISVADGGKVKSQRMCLGQYSYLWNMPSVIDSGESGSSAIIVDPNGRPINFVRVVDQGGRMCHKNASSGLYPRQVLASAQATSLLKRQSSGGDVVLAVYRFSATQVAGSANSPEGLYRLSFTVGTSKLSEINTATQTCRPPNDRESNLEFCAINQFEIIVRSNG